MHWWRRSAASPPPGRSRRWGSRGPRAIPAPSGTIPLCGASPSTGSSAGATSRASPTPGCARPAAPMAEACMNERFALLGRLGRHKEARLLVAQLRDEEDAGERTARVLARLSEGYPDPTLRPRAADAARVVAGRRLPQAAEPEAADLVSSLARLDPSDRLLSRDGRRFVERIRIKAPPPRKRFDPPQVRSVVTLPHESEWTHVASDGACVFAAGGGSQGFDPRLVRPGIKPGCLHEDIEGDAGGHSRHRRHRHTGPPRGRRRQEAGIGGIRDPGGKPSQTNADQTARRDRRHQLRSRRQLRGPSFRRGRFEVLPFGPGGKTDRHRIPHRAVHVPKDGRPRRLHLHRRR